MVFVPILNIRATASIGVPSHNAAKTKACFSLLSRLFAMRQIS
jgi:hypothetical protein